MHSLTFFLFYDWTIVRTIRVAKEKVKMNYLTVLRRIWKILIAEFQLLSNGIAYLFLFNDWTTVRTIKVAKEKLEFIISRYFVE